MSYVNELIEMQFCDLSWGPNSEQTELVRLDDGKTGRLYKVDRDYLGNTKLHIYAAFGYMEGIIELIRSSVHLDVINLTNQFGQTALHVATRMRQFLIARMLIICGADPYTFDIAGNTPFHMACIEGQLDCLHALVSSVRRNELEIAKLLVSNRKYEAWAELDETVNLDMGTLDGECCIHLAASRNHVDIVKYLIDNGADLNAATSDREVTALHIAIERENYETFQYLTKCPAININAKNVFGATPFQFAELFSRKDLQQTLLMLGATPSQPPTGEMIAVILGYGQYLDDSDDSECGNDYKSNRSSLENEYSDLDESY